MPDAELKTVSATQTPALFNRSPYLTKFMLYEHFVDGIDIEPQENERMNFGKLLQPAILQATGERLRLEIEPNEDDIYQRSERHSLGCTVDALVSDPSRGKGVIEAKNVDWIRWKDTWTDEMAPPHIEIQLQAQMIVQEAKWGVISCFVGGNELLLYERAPNEDLQLAIVEAAEQFMADVKAKVKPEVAGQAIELPVLDALYPEIVPEKSLDLRGEQEASEIFKEYRFVQGQKSFFDKREKDLKAKILGISQDAGTVVTHGLITKIKRNTTKGTVVTLPDEIRHNLGELAKYYDKEGCEIEYAELTEALEWEYQVRKAGTQTRISSDPVDEAHPAAWETDDDENILHAG